MLADRKDVAVIITCCDRQQETFASSLIAVEKAARFGGEEIRTVPGNNLQQVRPGSRDRCGVAFDHVRRWPDGETFVDILLLAQHSDVEREQ